jgi:hypothetical protein
MSSVYSAVGSSRPKRTVSNLNSTPKIQAKTTTRTRDLANELHKLTGPGTNKNPPSHARSSSKAEKTMLLLRSSKIIPVRMMALSERGRRNLLLIIRERGSQYSNSAYPSLELHSHRAKQRAQHCYLCCCLKHCPNEARASLSDYQNIFHDRGLLFHRAYRPPTTFANVSY